MTFKMPNGTDAYADVLTALMECPDDPRDRRPKLDTWESEGALGIVVREYGIDPADGCWIHAENPTEAEL